MAINVQYTPNLAALAGAAYQGGLGQFADKKRAEQLQRDLEAERLKDSKYRADLSVLNDQYLAQLQNQFATGSQLRGFQNANYQQGQSISDVQKRQQADLANAVARQQADIANQQQMQQAGFGQQTKLANQQEGLTRWQTEFGAENQQKLQQQQIEAQMRQTQAQIQDAQQRQQWALASERMSQMAQLQAQAQNLASQQQYNANALQFGLQADLTRQQQQAGLQGQLARQQFGQNMAMQDFQGQQNFGMQQLRGDQALGLAQQNYMQQNYLGPYAQDFATITAMQATQKDQQLMRNQQILKTAYQNGEITQSAYMRANNELTQQRAGLREELGVGGDEAMRNAALMENLYTPEINGTKVQMFWDRRGAPVPLEDPTFRHGVNTANNQAERVAKMMETDLRIKQGFADAWLKNALENGVDQVDPVTGMKVSNVQLPLAELQAKYMSIVGIQAR